MNALRLLDSFKQITTFQIFTIYLRYLIGGAFIIAAFGMGKITGGANLLHSMDAPIQDLQPIQQFFRVMSDSGMYWKFIGWSQIIGGLLLMTQRFARLGALIFFCIILNIFVITVSYGFSGTYIITGLMLLATSYLILWDTRVFLFLVIDKYTVTHIPLRVIDRPFWAWLGLFLAMTAVISFFAQVGVINELLLLFIEGFIGFLLFFLSPKSWKLRMS